MNINNTFANLDIMEKRQQLVLRKKQSDLLNLRKAKSFIISGNTEMAILFLDRINSAYSEVSTIKDRYLYTIHLIEGDYKKAYNILKKSRLYFEDIYPKICMQKILTMITIGVDNKFEREFERCTLMTEEYSKNDQIWFDAIRLLIQKDPKINNGEFLDGLAGQLRKDEITIMWLKLALYLNKEKVVLKNISEIPARSYENQRIRELIGFLYYRDGQIEKAIEFIEGIETPNSDNIRGNISLKKKEYEVAFGHFKLALERKENSKNALERAIPLAWLLKQWKEGERLIKYYIDESYDEASKITLDTAFKIRLEEFLIAEKQIRLVRNMFRKNLPREIDIMQSYVSLINNDPEDLEFSSHEACRSHDGLNCWITLQLLFWENISKTIQRTDKVHQSELDLDKLKEKETITKFNEEIFVDQRDIEELDSLQIKINPFN